VYAIGSLLVVVALSLLITRVATVILVATGLSSQAARFQARSAFTGSGFTTSESEKVVDHPLRRRVIMTLMLLGNAGIVASASTLIIGFQRLGAHSVNPGFRILLLGVGILLIVYLSRNGRVDHWLTRAIRRVLGRYTDLPGRDLAGLLDLSGDYAVTEMAVKEGDWVAGRRLGELELRDEGVAVLGITRRDGRYRGAPVGSTVVHAGDILVLYGRAPALNDIDHRPAGPEGEKRHEEAVARQRLLVGWEEREDREDRVAREDGVVR